MDDNTTPTPGPAPANQPAEPAAAPASAPTAPYPRPTGGGMVSQEDKSQATLVWALTIFFAFIPGLIFFITAKDKPFVYRQAALALTLAIVITVVDIVLMVTLVGAILIPLVWLAHIIISIMGAIAVNKGDDFNPPVITGLTKSIFKV